MSNRFILLGMLVGSILAASDFWPVGALAGLLVARSLKQLQLASEELKVNAALREHQVHELRQLILLQNERLSALEHSAAPHTSERPATVTAAEVAVPPAVVTTVVETTVVETIATLERAAAKTEPTTASDASTPIESNAGIPHASEDTKLPSPDVPLLRWSDTATAYVRELIFGGNTVVRAGIVVLLVGVTLLLKYAAENSILPLEVRMSAAGLLGMVLVLVGLRFRAQRAGFAETLQGGGVATMYLVIFFSYRVYSLLPATLAFFLLVSVAVLSGVLAVIQNSMSLIVIGQIGGFVAPILASSGGGSHVALFSYYLLLNLLVAVVAWFRSWRPLNLVGFVFTFGIGTAWGVLNYKPEHFATIEPFLVAFFLLYVAIPLLFALRGQTKGWVDASLVFGTPLAFLGLQLVLVRERPFFMAFTSVFVAALYLGLVRVLRHPVFAQFETMRSSFFALGVGFLTLAIPYGVDDSQLTSATWAVEGAGLYFLGVKQQRIFSRVAGVGLQVLAGCALLAYGYGAPHRDALPFLHGGVLASVFLLLGCLFIAQHAHHKRTSLRVSEAKGLQALIVWGLLLMLPAFFAEFERVVPVAWRAGAELSFLAGLGISLELVGRVRKWSAVRYAPASLGLLLVPLSLVWLMGHAQTMWSDGGLIAWPLYFLSLNFTLRGFVPLVRGRLGFLHVAVLWGFSLWTALSLFSFTDRLLSLSPPWELAAFGLPFVGALLGLVWARTSSYWPLSAERERYLGWGRLGLVGACLVMALLVNLSSGDDTLLGYLPLVNPGELFQVAAFLSVIAWWKSEKQETFVSQRTSDRVFRVILGLVFLAWNGLLARSMHRFFGVEWDLEVLWGFGPLQVAFAVSWALIGLVVTGLASQKKKRVAWILGASLLGAVVVKLFLLDLAKLSSVPKIATFLAVGVLLLLVGYFSPVPPARAQQAS